MMTSNDSDHQKVPIWIGTDCKLVSGINKSTTCQHVIQSLVRTENPSKFVIVEKWKKMERKLDPSVRILKVWKAWGDQKDDVALILRHHHSADGYIDKRISNKVLRRNKSSQHHKLPNHDENMEEVEVTEPMERLLKLVLTQGETIQAQIKKLRHQEDQIERYEEQMHRMRSLQEGENYVVESYLRDDKGKKLKSSSRDKNPRKSGRLKQHHHHHHHHNRDKSNNNSNTTNNNKEEKPDPTSQNPTVQTRMEETELPDEDDEDLLEKSELMERICDLNSKLTKEEEHLVKLGLKIKKYYERHKDTGNGTNSNSNCNTNHNSENPATPSSSSHPQAFPQDLDEDEESQREEEQQLLSQLESLRDVTNEQFSEIELNEKSLNELEEMLDSKHDHVARLTYQIQLVDEESEQLRQRLLKISQGFPPHPFPYHPHHHHPHQVHPQLHYFPDNPMSGSTHIVNPCPVPPSTTSTSSSSSSNPPSSCPPNTDSGGIPGSVNISSSSSSGSSPVNNNGTDNNSFNVSGPPAPPPPPPPTSSSSASSAPSGAALNSDSVVVVDPDVGDKLGISQIPNAPSNQPFTETAAAVNFRYQQHSENIPTTHLNLHIKPCRDHQDNDSNSDTGISSLHSSSDENTLFVLDTLV